MIRGPVLLSTCASQTAWSRPTPRALGPDLPASARSVVPEVQRDDVFRFPDILQKSGRTRFESTSRAPWPRRRSHGAELLENSHRRVRRRPDAQASGRQSPPVSEVRACREPAGKAVTSTPAWSSFVVPHPPPQILHRLSSARGIMAVPSASKRYRLGFPLRNRKSRRASQ